MPDFEEAGVELKSTPVKRDSKGKLVPKERLVLGLINYMNIVDETWETSSFLHKNKTSSLCSIGGRADSRISDYSIESVRLWSFPEHDLEIIRDDWETIVENSARWQGPSAVGRRYGVPCGRCEGPKATDTEDPALLGRPGEPRAFSLKQSYMKAVVDESLFVPRSRLRILRS